MATPLQMLEAFTALALKARSAAVVGYDQPIGVDPAGAAKRVAQLAAAAIFASPVAAPVRRIYLTKNSDDPYNGNLQTAINACVNPTAAEPWVVEILSPGEYVGPFVVPSPNIYLVSSVPGATHAVRLVTNSGVTLTIPDSNSGVSGIAVESTSANNADTALLIVPSAAPGIYETRCMGAAFSAPNGAAAVRSAPGVGSGLIAVFLSCFVQGNTPLLVEALGAGLALVGGPVVNEPNGGTVVRVANGSAVIMLNVIANNDPAGTGWLADADAGIIALMNVQSLNAANLMRVTNAGALIVFGVEAFNTSGVSLSVDASSTVLLGTLNTLPNSPYASFAVATPSSVTYFNTLDFLIGTALGPDTRPSAPKPGMSFFATDLATPVVLTFIPGPGWVDPSGTIIP